jgi:phage gpG-like protein
MTAQLTLRARDLPRVDHVLAELQRRATDTSPLMDRLGQAAVSDMQERFDTETTPGGARWTPSIRAREEGGKTLTQSARLRQSLTHNVMGRDRVEAGTNVIYAGVHNQGATIRAKSGGKLTFRLPGGLGFRSVDQVIIPQREFIGISDDGEEELISQAEDFLAEVLP